MTLAKNWKINFTTDAAVGAVLSQSTYSDTEGIGLKPYTKEKTFLYFSTYLCTLLE